jgi:di/tricarboxylate transporter
LRQPPNLVMAEAAVAPNSRLEGRFLQHVNFKAQTGCTIIGLQRHRRMLRARLDTIRLQAGDVLLILGPQDRVLELRSDRDLLVLEGSVTRVPHFAAAGRRSPSSPSRCSPPPPGSCRS